tara:strand:- start:4938 stop:5123 length:186 start_codon:yes stop_codon:yes gene_type:complete
MKEFIEASGRDIPEGDMEKLLLMKEYKLQRYLRRYPMKVESVKKVVPKAIPKVIETVDEEE